MSALWVDGAVVPAAGDLVQFGELGSESVELVVKSITPGADLSARLTAVDHAPAIFTAATQEIPDFDPQITAPPGELQPVIDTLRSDETVLARDDDGSLKPRILVTFALAANRPYHLLESIAGQIRPDTLDGQWRDVPPLDPYATDIAIADVQSGEAYQLRFRFRLRRVRAGTPASPGPWTTATHTVIGTTTLPPDVPQFWLQGTRLWWLYPDKPRDFAGFQIREHTGTDRTWSNARPIHAALIADSTFDIEQTERTLKTFLIKALDTAGNESAQAAALTVAIGSAVFGDALIDNIVFTRDYAAENYPGVLTGAALVGAELHALDNGELFWGADDALFWDKADDALFWDVTYQALVFETEIVPDIVDPVTGLELRNPTLLLDTEFEGEDARILYRPGDTNRFWDETETNRFWGADDEVFWPAEANEWVAWPGQLENPRRQRYPLRVEIRGGAKQGKIKRLRALLDVPDLEEALEDVVIAPGGTRLPVTQTYQRIKNVSLTLQDDGGTAVTLKIIDKDRLGPLVQAFDAAGLTTAATIDARLQGY